MTMNKGQDWDDYEYKSGIRWLWIQDRIEMTMNKGQDWDDYE